MKTKGDKIAVGAFVVLAVSVYWADELGALAGPALTVLLVTGAANSAGVARKFPENNKEEWWTDVWKHFGHLTQFVGNGLANLGDWLGYPSDEEEEK